MDYDHNDCAKPIHASSELDPGGGPHPRCLSALPQNIEDLLSKFRSQEESVSPANSSIDCALVP